LVGVLASCNALEPIFEADEIIKAREVIQETSEIFDPETVSESISESPTVVIT